MKHKLIFWTVDLVKSTKTQTIFIQIIISFFFLYSGSTFCIFVVTQLAVNCKKILSI